MDDNIPTITGRDASEPAPGNENVNIIGASTPAIQGVRRAPKSIGELVAELMYRTKNPNLAQVMILDAIEKFSEAASKLDVEAFDASEMGQVIDGQEWKDTAIEINRRVREHVDFVNQGGLGFTPSDPVMSTQARITAYIEALKKHDWAQPMPAELIAEKAELDPTGEIEARFKPAPHAGG